MDEGQRHDSLVSVNLSFDKVLILVVMEEGQRLMLLKLCLIALMS